jgi:hypothetical protein
MATDVATLSIKVVHDDVDRASKSLDNLARSGAKAEASTGGVGRAVAKEMATAGTATKSFATGIETATASATNGIAAAAGQTKSLVTGLESATVAAKGMVAALAAGAVLAIGIGIGHKIIEESKESQDALAQLEAGIKSTGGAAGLTSKELQDMATHLQDVSTESDEAVERAQALLLTFTNIRGNNFRDATVAVVDMAKKMGGLESASIQVGKALNDPIKGVTALQKVGVSFTDSQKEQIKALVDSGRAAQAQQLILKELRTEFGGSAEAARNTLGGALTHLSNVWGDLFEVSAKSSGGVILAINAIADAIPHVRTAIEDFVTNTIVGANNITAAWQKLNAVMSADLTKGLAPVRAELRRIEEERAAANALARSPGVDAGLPGGAAPQHFNESEEATKARTLAATRQEELNKLVAVNAAYGQATLTQQILGIQYDANIQKAKDRAELHGREAGRVNALTDAIARQKIITLELADAEARADRLRATQRGNFGQTRAAQQNAELARIEAAQSRRVTSPIPGVATTDEAARRRIDLKAENDLLAARLDYAEKTRKATADQVATAQAEYQSTVNRVNAEHDLAIEAQRVREENERVLAVQRAATGVVEDALDALERHENPLKKWVEDARRATNHWIAEIVGQKVGSIFGDIIGRGPDAAAAKQITAGTAMNVAADKMLTAAQLMTGAPAANPTGSSVGSPANTTQKTPTISPALQKALGYAAIAFGGFQTGESVGAGLYSTSHGTFGNYARGALGGAAAGALTGAAIGSVVGPIGTAAGAVIGGVTGLVGGILGIGSASKEAKKQIDEMRKAVASDMASLRASVAKDSLESAKAAAEEDRERRRKAIEDAYSGGGANSDTVRQRNALLKEMNALEDQYIQQLEQEARVKQERTIEDYEARAAAATPGNEAAESEASFVRSQRREREDLIASFGPEIDAREAATLAALDNAQAAELAAAKAKGFADAISNATSVLNAPSGFKVEPYIYDYQPAAKRPPIPEPAAPLTLPANRGFAIPQSPQFASASGSSSATSSRTGAMVQVLFQSGAFVVNESKTPKQTAEEIAKAVVRQIDLTKETYIGPNVTRAEALELMPS